MRTALIGVGRMGRAMADRLVDEGHDVSLWNRTPERAAGIPGTRVCASPAAAAAKAQVILCMLSDDAATEAAYLGTDGLCSAALAGKVVVEMSTISPGQVQRLAAAIADQGGMFLECPVGGTIGPARDGKLLGLAGGSDAAFTAARPVLKSLTRRLEHLGPVGTGAAMKLAINLPLMVYWGAVGEAIGIACAGGVDPTLAVDVLADSSGAIGAAKKRLPQVATFRDTGNAGGVALSLANGIKDMRLMEALAEAHGIDSSVIAAARARAEKVAAAGWSDLDASLYGLFGQTEVAS